MDVVGYDSTINLYLFPETNGSPLKIVGTTLAQALKKVIFVIIVAPLWGSTKTECERCVFNQFQ